MKESSEKKLRAQRRSLSDSDHRRHTSAAAKAILRLRMFSAGKRRLRSYLPFRSRAGYGSLDSAGARQRGVQIFVPVISDRRHCACVSSSQGETRRGAFGVAVPRLRVTPVSPQWLISSSYRWLASIATVGGWGWGVDTMTGRSHSAAGVSIGWGPHLSGSP